MDREKLESLVSEANGHGQIVSQPDYGTRYIFDSIEDLEAFADLIRQEVLKSFDGTLEAMMASVQMAVQTERMACIRACVPIEGEGVQQCIQAIRARGWE